MRLPKPSLTRSRGLNYFFYSLAALLLQGLFPLIGKEVPRATPAEVGMSTGKLDAAAAVVKSYVDQKKIAGAITIVARRGHIVDQRTYGHMDIERSKPMREDAIFRIYSMSKSIITAGALMLHEEGKFELEDPVHNFLPTFKNLKVLGKDTKSTHPIKKDMTVADLMRHTSGLSYGFVGNTRVEKAYNRLGLPGRAKNLDTFVAQLAKVPLRFEPGEKWLYSVSTDVLGKLVEVWSGKSLDVFLAERIFNPLDMRDTGFHVPKDKLPRFTANYGSDGKGGLRCIDDPLESNYSKPPTFFSGGGGLVSTGRDYLRFLLMVQQGGHLQGTRLLKSETVNLMTTNQLPKKLMPIQINQPPRSGVGFGYGFSVRTKMTEWDPGAKVGEFGWGGAASTHYWVHPKDELVVVTLEQTMPYSFLTEWGIKKLIYEAIEN